MQLSLANLHGHSFLSTFSAFGDWRRMSDCGNNRTISSISICFAPHKHARSRPTARAAFNNAYSAIVSSAAQPLAAASLAKKHKS